MEIGEYITLFYILPPLSLMLFLLFLSGMIFFVKRCSCENLKKITEHLIDISSFDIKAIEAEVRRLREKLKRLSLISLIIVSFLILKSVWLFVWYGGPISRFILYISLYSAGAIFILFVGLRKLYSTFLKRWEAEVR